jgi:hypothetical protein
MPNLLDSLQWLPILCLLMLLPFAIIFLWCLISWTVALGGWQPLANVYRAKLPVTGKLASVGFGMVGIARYKRTLQLMPTPAGLYLCTTAVVPVGHPPLLIPWAAFHHPQRWSFLNAHYVQFEVGEPCITTLVLPQPIVAQTPALKQLLVDPA